jgi:uncharacterized membrane protein YkvA (DUF1232 family)
VPRLTKALLALPTLYLVAPVDAVPDIAPIIGQLDDLGVLLLALQTFIRLCPLDAVGFHRHRIANGRPYTPMSASDVVIDAEWRRGS